MTSSWFFLSTLNYDARSTTHQIYRHSISIKMAVSLKTCTREEQRSVIRFLRSEGVKPIEIHRRMTFKYCDACLSQQQVYDGVGSSQMV